VARFTLEIPAVPDLPFGDKAYDSDPLAAELAERSIELIVPHKLNRVNAPTQDGHALRRWKVERLWAWLQNFRRVATRFDYHVENFLGLVHLGCIFRFFKGYLHNRIGLRNASELCV
jgi:hypothetical protein